MKRLPLDLTTSPRARQIIEHGQNWKLWVLCDREPIPNWTDGQVALLVDATHPMLQYFTQGDCMAMEDAVCVATMLDRHRDDVAKVSSPIKTPASPAPRGFR